MRVSSVCVQKLMAPVRELYSERERLCREASVAVRKGEGGRSKELMQQALLSFPT